MDDLRVGNVAQVPNGNYEKVNKKGPLEFGKVIKGAIQRVNELEKDADQSIMDLLNGKANVHETMVNLQKFDISMRLFLTIRNKAIEAYKEIIHMQLFLVKKEGLLSLLLQSSLKNIKRFLHGLDLKLQYVPIVNIVAFQKRGIGIQMVVRFG